MNSDLENLKKEQVELSKKLILEDRFPKHSRIIGGIDQAFLKENIISALVLFDMEKNETIYRNHIITKADFPYISGFLSYREAPAALELIRKSKKPDILLVDGSGIIHPRGMGLASHIGLLTGLPTIGTTKSRLCGEYNNPEETMKPEKITLNNKHVGYALKTIIKGKLILISPGHKVSVDSSLKVVIQCLRGHKLPEPLHVAHLYCNSMKKTME